MANKNNKIKYAIGLGIAGLLVYLISRPKPAAAAAPPLKYSCSGSPDYICYPDVDGTLSLAECEDSCSLITVPIDITVTD